MGQDHDDRDPVVGDGVDDDDDPANRADDVVDGGARRDPEGVRQIHPKYLTPTWSTWAMGLASVAWYLVLITIDKSENILWDSISGLGFGIAFYYGMTALASPILFRKVLRKSWKHFVLAGVVPVLAAMSLL